jgi:prepilin-type N-terminal cleavage/methylation domain-containing protein
LGLNALVAPPRTFTTDRRDHLRGFSVVELLVVLAIIGAVGVAATPSLLSYWRAAWVQAGARELASAINFGRQLAISRKVAVCLDLTGTSLRLRTGGCTGPVWTGPVTDAAGVIRISDPAALEVSANARVVFTPLGAASPSATYTVTHPPTRTSRTVVVAASGRVSLE